MDDDISYTPYNLHMQNKSFLTLDRIFDTDEFKSKSFGPARWLDDDSGYTTLEPSPNDQKIKEIVCYAIPSMERTVLVTADHLTPTNADKPLSIKNYTWSSDKKHMLIFTNTKRVWRQHTRGDYWMLNLENGTLTQLGGTTKPATLMFAKFAPDNQSVAYVCANNIYIETLADNQITQLTYDGGEHLINGTSDWVYEEEFHLRDGFCWSPDSQRIAYWQFDTTGIKPFYMINNTASLYPQLIPLPYPKVGTPNSACRIGVVDTRATTTWIDLPGDPRQHYIPKMEWAATSEEIIIQQFNRLQNQNKVFLGNASNGRSDLIFIETDPAWIDAHNDLKWLADGAAFTWVSDRDGWRHLYRISRDGQETTLLTPGNYDVIAVQTVDDDGGWVYFIASPDNATQRYLYRVYLNGDGLVQRLSPVDASGTHAYQISPHAKWAIHHYSTFETPPTISLISLPDHQQVQVLEANQKLHAAVSGLKRPSLEFFRVSIKPDDGDTAVELDGWHIKPPDFNPNQKYPLLFFVYGEPANQTVLDRWGGERQLWHMLLAQQGYHIISIDNRGTPAPRGVAWRKSVYRQVGIMSTADQAAAAEEIINSRAYIDTERVGVWGWSGGGSMTLNLMFRHADIYKTGIAIAAVSNMRYYDTVYQERYMGLPDDNAEGYKNGSPITFAAQLEGNLMLIHGTGDDNVHYQCFEAVVDELIKHNKQFAMMAYPNRSHAIKEGRNTSRHLYTTMTSYLQVNL